MTRETHYAIRYTSRSGEHITDYGTDTEAVRRDYNGGLPDSAGVQQELLAREITTGPWKPARLPRAHSTQEPR